MDSGRESCSGSFCPQCAKDLGASAKVCPFCGFIVEASVLASALKPYIIPPSLMISVIMPIYNEKDTVKTIIEKVQAIQINKEVIVVDDGSTDGTHDVLSQIKAENLKICRHKKNQGKGAAIRTAIEHVKGDIVIIQDADLEYDPQDYYRLIEPIVDGRADVVYGSRFIGEVHRVLLFWHYLGNKLLTTLSNMFNNLNLTDMETCYKVFKAEVLKGIKLKSNRFGFEPEITAKVAKKKCRIYEMPISYSGRDYTEGKKIGWKDGLAAFVHIVRFRFLD